MEEKQLEYLGTFGVGSKLGGKLVISDPTYKLGTWCNVIVPVKGGEWKAYAERKDCGEWGNRVASLVAVHSDYEIGKLKEEYFEPVANVGIDSGTMSIVDIEEWKNSISMSEVMWEKINGANGASIVPPYGVTCASGYGDGVYMVEGAGEFNDRMLQNQFHALRIIFIEDEEEE